MNTTVCFVAGHSGGHILPCITKAQQLIDAKLARHILFFSTSSLLDQKIVHQHPFPGTHIFLEIESFPYRNTLRLPRFIFSFLKAIVTSFHYLKQHRPAYVVSTGGYVAIPVCLAAWMLRIPIELYELNVEPGKAITVLARIAQKILVLYPESRQYLPAHKCEVTTYPIRFSEQHRAISQEQAIAELGLVPSRKTICVLGGSQGSLFLNSLMKLWIEQLPEPLRLRIQVIHQTGALDATDWQSWYATYAIPAVVFTYKEDIAHAYQAADIVICRAGAGILAEVQFFNKKAIIIPLETQVTAHQLRNALALHTQVPTHYVVLRQAHIENDIALFAQAMSRVL